MSISVNRLRGRARPGRTDKKQQDRVRKPRADALRNRDRLLVAAKAAFAEAGAEVALEEIARRAEVGIGTLYRHFPTRDAIVEAVYRREVEQLAEAAARLGETLPPGEALRQWLHVSVGYIAAKKVIAPALGSSGGASELRDFSRTRITEAMSLLVERARATGDIRPDADSADLFRALIGFAAVSTGADWEASARRLIDILMDGLRAGRSES